ncbi:MAG: flagellar biosynthetic protein FliR [Planctomycetota bacterium]
MMPADSLAVILSAEPTLVAGVAVRMAVAVAAGGLPMFAWLDMRVKAAATLVLAAVALPAAAPAGEALPLAPLLVGEAVVGLGLGLAAALAFAAAAWAGGILGTVSGLSWAADFTPDAPGGEGDAARLAAWLGIAGFLAAGGHLAIVAGLVDSVGRMPIGTLAATGGAGLAELVATLPTAALELALALAAPALAAVLAFHVAAAICLRAVRFAPGHGLLQAAASLVLLGAICAGAAGWTSGFAAAARHQVEQSLGDLSR